MTAGTRRPWEVRLTLPRPWFGLACDASIDRVEVPAAVRARLEEEPDLGAADAMTEVLLGWSATAAKLGAAAAAMRWGVTRRSGWAWPR